MRLSAMVGQSKLLPPEKMKHSIKLVDDQMNWCDSAMEVSQSVLSIWGTFVVVFTFAVLQENRLCVCVV